MPTQIYKDMIDVMVKRGGPYSGAEIPEFYSLMEEMFTPEEAEVNNALPLRQPVTAAELAKKMRRDEIEIRGLLEGMADKGLCSTVVQGKKRVYQGEPFMPGIFEFQFLSGRTTERDRKIARLIHAYKKAYVAAVGAPELFLSTRVITVDRMIKSGNRIHTYDQVATYIDKYEAVGLATCYCRHAAKLRGEDVHGMPLDVCMWFGPWAEYAVERLGSRKVSKQEALDVLKRSEEAGLIHMSRNTTEDINFLCNCDRWHCESVAMTLKHPKPGLVFNSGFMPQVYIQRCTGCGICIDRCPPEALKMNEGGRPETNLDRCFGCAVCASGCPENAIAMEAKQNWPEPPKTMKDLITAIKAAR